MANGVQNSEFRFYIELNFWIFIYFSKIFGVVVH